MDVPRPAPGEELNSGAAVEPRAAATVMLVRGGEERLEVLLVQRTPRARFMAGAWVFPGGSVSAGDGEGQAGLRAAAVREVREEAGVCLPDADQLVLFSRWITPAEVKIRFDTWFYLAPLPAQATPQIDGAEVVDARWYEPDQALAASRRHELLLVFPTIKHLEQLAAFQSADELMAKTRGREVQPVQPRVTGSGEAARIVMPGEPGYSP